LPAKAAAGDPKTLGGWEGRDGGIMGWIMDGSRTGTLVHEPPEKQSAIRSEAAEPWPFRGGMGALNLVRREQTRDDPDEPREMPLFCCMIPSWDSCRSSVTYPPVLAIGILHVAAAAVAAAAAAVVPQPTIPYHPSFSPQHQAK
jgi:hypothetical protein